MFTKKFAWVLIAAQCLTLSACSQPKNPPEDTAETETTAAETTTNAPETQYLDTLPDTKYDGQTFTLLGVDYATRRNFYTEEEDGDVVNDALGDRDRFVEETYGVDIVTISEAKAGDLKATVEADQQAGDHSFDLMISDIASCLSALMLSGHLYDLRSIPHLQLEAGWWSVGMYENASANGKQYITMGDISPMKYYAPFCEVFNKRLAEDYKLGDLYQVVREGKWTWDRFQSIVRDLNRDLDGDGVVNAKDFFGYCYLGTDITAYSHYAAMGQKLSEKDKDGNIVVNITSDASVQAVEKLRNLFSAIPAVAVAEQTGIFLEGRALFIGNSYSSVIGSLREMEDDFGVLPTPKMDEEQENYVGYINTWCLGGVAVPVSCQKADMVGHLAEVLCYTSYTDVRPALYDSAMKMKVSRDKETSEMLDIIFNNTYVDYNGILNFGGSGKVLANAIFAKDELISAYAAVKDTIAADIAKLSE